MIGLVYGLLFFLSGRLDFTSVFWKSNSRQSRTYEGAEPPPHYIYLTQCIPPTLCLLRIRHLPNVAPWISLPRHLPLVSRSTFCGLSIPICCGSDTAPDYFTPCIHIILNLLKPFETVTYLDITSSFPNVSYDTWDHFRFLMLSLRIFYFFWS